MSDEPLRIIVVHHADRVTHYHPVPRRQAFDMVHDLLDVADALGVLKIDVLSPETITAAAAVMLEADFVKGTRWISPDEEMPLDTDALEAAHAEYVRAGSVSK